MAQKCSPVNGFNFSPVPPDVLLQHHTGLLPVISDADAGCDFQRQAHSTVLVSWNCCPDALLLIYFNASPIWDAWLVSLSSLFKHRHIFVHCPLLWSSFIKSLYGSHTQGSSVKAKPFYPGILRGSGRCTERCCGEYSFSGFNWTWQWMVEWCHQCLIPVISNRECYLQIVLCLMTSNVHILYRWRVGAEVRKVHFAEVTTCQKTSCILISGVGEASGDTSF